MGEIKFISKKHIGSGNFEYTYQCTCVPSVLKTIKVTSGNDNQAKILAQEECNEYCSQNAEDLKQA